MGNTKKLFGEFLLERGLITERILLDALMVQENQLPSVQRVVYEQGLLDTQQLLMILSHRQKKNISFTQAATELGIWNGQLESQVNEFLSQYRVPLGQILVKSGEVNFEPVARALVQYLDQVEGSSSEAKPTSGGLSEKLKTSRDSLEPKPSNYTLPFVPQFQEVGRNLMGEYSTTLSDGKRERLEKLVNSWEQNQNDNDFSFDFAQKIEKTINSFGEIRGMAQFVQAPLTAKLVEQWESALTLFYENLNQFNPKDLAKLAPLGRKIISIVYELKQELKIHQTEKNYWDQNKDRYCGVFQELELVKNALLQELRTRKSA